MNFQPEQLKEFCVDIMRKAGLSENESLLAADSLVEANMRGVHSHGVSRLRAYSSRVQAGVVAAGAAPEIVNDSPTALLVDGKKWYGRFGWCVYHGKMPGPCRAVRLRFCSCLQTQIISA